MSILRIIAWIVEIVGRIFRRKDDPVAQAAKRTNELNREILEPDPKVASDMANARLDALLERLRNQSGRGDSQ